MTGEIGIAGNGQAIGEAVLQLDPIVLRVKMASALAAAVGDPQLGFRLAFAEDLGTIGVAEILLVSLRRGCSQPCQAEAQRYPTLHDIPLCILLFEPANANHSQLQGGCGKIFASSYLTRAAGSPQRRHSLSRPDGGVV